MQINDMRINIGKIKYQKNNNTLVEFRIIVQKPIRYGPKQTVLAHQHHVDLCI